MNKKRLSERDICTKFITPALRQAGWDEQTQLREEVSFTKGRVIVRGKMVRRGEAKRADYILYCKPNIPLAVIEAKDNNCSVGDGDVAIAKITPCFENGKSAVFAELTGGIGAATTELHVIRPILVNPQFLLIVLKSPFFIGGGVPKMTGTAGQKRVPTEYFAKTPFPVPPLAEQTRIISRVDELMALCGRLEAAQAERETRRHRVVAASLQRLNEPAEGLQAREDVQFCFNRLPRVMVRAEHLTKLRRTILCLAVQGRLVPQDDDEESAHLLHKHLTAARDAELGKGRAADRMPLPGAATVVDAVVFPSSWVLTNLDSVNLIASGVAKGKDLRGLKTSMYPYLRVANVQRGYLDLTVVKSIEIAATEIERYRLEPGDVLMTEGGDWDKLGRAAIWRGQIDNCIHQNHIFRIRSADATKLLPQWVALFANSPLGRSYFESASKQTTNLASINMTQLRSCPLPLPPTAEQHRIVDKVDELMAVCDQLEAQITTGESVKARFLEALLHEALDTTATVG